MDVDTSSVNRISLKKALRPTENLIRGSSEVPRASHPCMCIACPTQNAEITLFLVTNLKILTLS